MSPPHGYIGSPGVFSTPKAIKRIHIPEESGNRCIGVDRRIFCRRTTTSRPNANDIPSSRVHHFARGPRFPALSPEKTFGVVFSRFSRPYGPVVAASYYARFVSG